MSDRFTYPFDQWIWQNLRKSIRSLGSTSLFYLILFSVTFLFVERAKRASWLYRQIWLSTASGYGLDLWGQRYKIPRNYGESDDAYKARMIKERLIGNGDASNRTRKLILQIVFGIDPANVKIERIYDHHFEMGGMIGAPIASRDYAIYGYRIYAPSPGKSVVDSLIFKATKLLKKTNFGGNLWTLWFEEGAVNQPGVNTDIPIWQAPNSAIRQYDIR